MRINPGFLARTVFCGSLLCLATATHAETIFQWDFNSGNLAASSGGQDLSYYDGDGSGATAAGTHFGTTTALGIPNINGVPAAVMNFPACTQTMGYQMPTTPDATGPSGVWMVNDYTLIMDLLYTGPAATAWRSLIQIDSAAAGNNNDGDFFVHPTGGIGIANQYSGQILSNTWHRVGLVMDVTAGLMRKYVDGTLVGTMAVTADGRWSLTPSAFTLLFADNDNETAIGYVNSIQLRDRALNSGEMGVLGAPTAAGIPTTIAAVPSFVEQLSPASNAVSVVPFPAISAVINRGTTTINSSSVKLSLDGVDLAASVTVTGDQITATATPATAFQPSSFHVASVRYIDSTAGARTNTWSFTVLDYQNLTLPAPLFMETFDGLAEGTLPAGWSVTNATTSENAWEDLGDPTSDSYLNWVVIDTNRVASIFGAATITTPPVVVNGSALNLISNNIIYATSDFRGNLPNAQVQTLFTSSYNLSGKANIFLAFNLIYEQNADSFGGVEYSVDGGTTWLPALYLIEKSRIVRDAGAVDAVATLNTAREDQPYGASFGSFIGAPITPALAPFIRGVTDDSRTEGKRVEVLRCVAADNQANVRFRFVHAGSFSWYFGMDNVGIYSITVIDPPTVAVTPSEQTDISGMAMTYFNGTANGTGPLTYQWYRNGAGVPGKTDAQLSFGVSQVSDSGLYTLVVRNAGGAVTSSPPVKLTINQAPLAQVTGQWDFNQGDLRATIGQPLQYFDAQVQTDTTFDTTTAFGIPDIAGQPAHVLHCAPSVSTAWGGYVVTHGIAPNGGGTKVNEYTLILDLLYPPSSGYRGLWQTDPANASDSDLFVNGAALGISSSYQGTLTNDTWHRVVFTLDLTKRELGKYIDGVNVIAAPTGATPLGIHAAQYLSTSTSATAGGGVDLRWSLGLTALLLADEDGEIGPVYLSSVQIRNARLTDAAIAAMGAPTANKIPGAIKASKSGSTVVIDWTGTVLEAAPSLDGPWSTVSSAAHPYVVAAPAAGRFFRVRQ
jgi:hypothetical protein